MTAASGTIARPLGLTARIPGEPPGLGSMTRAIIRITRRVDALGATAWAALGPYGGDLPARRAAARWERLAREHAARQRAAAEDLGDVAEARPAPEPPAPPEPTPSVAMDRAAFAELERKIKRALG